MTNTTILAAWEAFRAAHIDLDQMDDELLGTETEEENAIWERVDAAEQIIFETPATSPQGIQCKLMVALYHKLSQRVDSQALLAGLFEALEAKERDMDWPERMILSAIQSARRMRGAFDSASWDAGMQAYTQASKAFAAAQAENPAGDELDPLCNALTDAEDALFGMDAPHMQAALWKLDRLQEEADGSSINPEQIRRVSTDIRRLIGEA